MFKRLKPIKVFLLAFAVAVTCWPGTATPQDGSEGKFSGEFLFYGGTLDDRTPPTRRDTKLSIEVSGPFAAQLFRRMAGGPQQDNCGDNQEWKARDELVCIRDRTTGKVDCYFGFDMRSGKSIGGVIC